LGSPCALSGGDPGVGLIYELFGWEGIACDAGAQ
jgi:hypothetical protein